MKKNIIALAAILILAAPVSAAIVPFQEVYDNLGSMSLEELEKLYDEIGNKIAELKNESGSYPWDSFEKYEDKHVYAIGETWHVEGLWNFTVNSAYRSAVRSEETSENPADVFVVTYTYENLGFDGDPNGLQFSFLTDASIIDSDGEIGYTYGHTNDFPEMSLTAQRIPIGSRITVTDVIGLNHYGNCKIIIDHRGNNNDFHYATFDINEIIG